MDGKEDGYMNEQTVMSCADCGWHVKQLKFWDEHHHFPYVTWWCSHPNVLRNFNANAPVDRGYCPPRTKPDKIYYNLLKGKNLFDHCGGVGLDFVWHTYRRGEKIKPQERK